MKTLLIFSWSIVLMVGATFEAFSAGARPGSLDRSFFPEQRSGTVFALVEQPDGRILVGGYFGLIRVLPNGETDDSFQAPLAGWPSVGMPPIVSALALQADGRILVGGQFEAAGFVPAMNLTRLMPDGSRDETFSPGASPNWPVESIVLQPDGRILIGGRFEEFGGVPVPALVRLLDDGRLDSSFDAGSGPDEFVFGILLQPDGRLLIRGNFSTFNGVARHGLARVLADGTLDPSFTAEALGAVWVPAFALQDDQIIVSAYLDFGPGVQKCIVARLDSGGALDARFQVNPNDGVQAIVVQRDGRIVVGGFFSEIDGVSRHHVARLTSNGRVDLSFTAGAGVAGQIDDEWSSPGIYNLLLSRDHKILAGGNYSLFDGQPRSGIARLQGGSPLIGSAISTPVLQYTLQ